ncbi:MAG: hydroxymethylbilane synthase [Thermoplasmataceae archaeon]
MEQRLILGARPSKLSLAQCKLASEQIARLGVERQIKTIISSGDRDLNSPLYMTKGQGIFVEDLNRELINGNIDVAVHSAKDLPTKLHPDLQIVAVLPREDPRDCLVSELEFERLESGSIIGTSSLRRSFEIRRLRPDLQIRNVRGNIDTRISKVGKGYDAVVLAEAGIIRLAPGTKRHPFTVDEMVPAPNQGIIALVCAKNTEAAKAVAAINDQVTYSAMFIERRITAALDLGCSAPAGILATPSGNGWLVRSRFYSADGRDVRNYFDRISRLDEIEDLASELKRRLDGFVGKVYNNNEAD